MTGIEVRPALRESEIAEARALFDDYAVWIGIDLSFQNFPEELKTLPGDYVPPGGALFLGWAGGAAAGCVAVRRMDDTDCEMKRLFVRDAFRGLGAGEALARAAIVFAREAGYGRMFLDTLPSMGAAHSLYERLGFKEIPPYRFNPVAGARFMALSLSER